MGGQPRPRRRASCSATLSYQTTLPRQNDSGSSRWPHQLVSSASWYSDTSASSGMHLSASRSRRRSFRDIFSRSARVGTCGLPVPAGSARAAGGSASRDAADGRQETRIAAPRPAAAMATAFVTPARGFATRARGGRLRSSPTPVSPLNVSIATLRRRICPSPVMESTAIPNPPSPPAPCRPSWGRHSCLPLQRDNTKTQRTRRTEQHPTTNIEHPTRKAGYGTLTGRQECLPHSPPPAVRWRGELLRARTARP